MAQQKAKSPVPPGVHIASACAGGITFVALFIGLNIPLPVSAVSGIAAWIGTLLLLHPRPKSELLMVDEGITETQFESILKKISDATKEMKTNTSEVVNQTVKERAQRICAAAVKIYEDLKADPKDIRRARQFINYYFDATNKILSRYNDLASRGVKSKEVTDSLAKAEDLLITIEKAYERQLEKLLSDDVLDLNAEIEVLQRSIQSDGIGGK